MSHLALLQTAPKFRDSGRPIVTITTPSMRIEAKQRKPTKPAQVGRCMQGTASAAVAGPAAGKWQVLVALLLAWLAVTWLQLAPRGSNLCAPVHGPPTLVQIADPLYGEWFDVFVTVLHPLALPVTGILGECCV